MVVDHVVHHPNPAQHAVRGRTVWNQTMATSHLDRTAAVSRTKAARIAALVLAAGGVLIAIIGLPGLSLPAIPKIEIAEPVAQPAATTTGPAHSNVNFAAVAERFAMVNNRPVVPVVEVPTVDANAPTETAPPPPPAEVAKFLGVVNMMKSRMALIAREEKQSFVKVGDKIGEHTVREINDDQLILEAGGERTTISLTAKGEDMVTHAAAAAGATNPFGNVPGAPRAPQRPGNAAQNAALAARGAKGNPAARAIPQPTQPQVNPSFPYAHIMADPQRRQRFAEIQAKLRNAGEYKSQMELDEAAAKMTDDEFGGSGQKGVK